MEKTGKQTLAQPQTRYHIPIKEWPEDERPREKLMRRGAHVLADAELLAILIRTGTAKQSALDLARQMVKDGKNLRGLAGKSAVELMRMKGIGQAKAVELLAAFEIGRRIQGMKEDEKMIPRLRDLRKEEFYVLVLDSKNGLKHETNLSTGTLNASLVHPREVYKVAIDHDGAAIIVLHNHPSGNPEPSKEDIEITRQLAEAGRIIGIPLHDHLIVAGDGYTSFAERGLL
jgi:DNA repair protein RadC